MKANQKKGRRLLAILLSFMLLFGEIPMTAGAETPAGQRTEEQEPATQTDLISESVTFEQQEKLDNILITVTADAGVFAPDARLDIRTVRNREFTAAVEEALETEANETTIIRHTVWEMTGTEMYGSALVKMEKLGLAELRETYPEGELSVYVLYDEDETRKGSDRAKAIRATVNLEKSELSFRTEKTGRYDTVTVIRLPDEGTPDEDTGDPEEETPDEDTGNPEEEPRDNP